jgi:hypothetical protein
VSPPDNLGSNIQSFASLFVILLIVTPGLDRRFGWSIAPTFLVVICNGLVAIGFLIMFIVFKENSHAASIITVDRDQKVVSTGPPASAQVHGRFVHVSIENSRKNRSRDIAPHPLRLTAPVRCGY